MRRRQLLKMGCVGTAGILTPQALWSFDLEADKGLIQLSIEPCDVEMIDGEIVYMLKFISGDQSQPVIRALEGERVRIVVRNNDTEPHGFAITGIPGATISSIPAGAQQLVQFVAPAGGSYMYIDPTNAPLNRILGLHGAFIVRPRLGTTLYGSMTPFSRHTQTEEIRLLFDALGSAAGSNHRFPGEKWNATDPNRDKIWIFSQTDPELNARAEAGEQIDGATIVNSFLPRYFHINDLSGFDTADHDDDDDPAHAAARAIMPRGREGQPTLLRTMNAGLATHSPHIHGNPVFQLTKQDANDQVSCETNIFEIDTWLLRPLVRKDMLLPFERPSDIPPQKWPPREEPFPLRYVMHCHAEMSQTAAGGNYPQGLVTHWEMTAPL